MSLEKCFSVVSSVVEEATNQFKPLWELNKEDYRILEQYCSVIDSLAYEYDGESIGVSVDEMTMSVSITLECDYMTVESVAHVFYSLVERSKSLCFSTTDNQTLLVKFEFPSVWCRS